MKCIQSPTKSPFKISKIFEIYRGGVFFEINSYNNLSRNVSLQL